MRRVVFEEWELRLIEELRVARLATVAPTGAPHLVPVCFTHLADAFWIPVDEKPKRSSRLARLRNIGAEPRVSLLFDRYDDNWSRLAWIRVDGLATVMGRGSEAPASLGALRSRYPQYRAMALESLPLVRVEPREVTGWRWEEP
jgi:PPOX class probable F420-dependent enzyme